MKLKILGIILLFSLVIALGFAWGADRTGVPVAWYLARASGIVGYLLLYVLLISGMGLTAGFIYRLAGPVSVWRYHRAIGITTGAAIAVHLISLYLERVANLNLADLLIPFHSSFYPQFLSAGIIGFYLFIIITLTSIFLIKRSYGFWRVVHYLSFVTFAAIFYHGVFLGTDTKTLAMQIVYSFTGLTVLMTFIYRLLNRFRLFSVTLD